MKRFLSIVLAVIMLVTAAPLSESIFGQTEASVAVTAQAAKAKKKIRVKKANVTVTLGFSFTQKLLNKKGKVISATKVKWKSGNKKVATISKKGKITPKKAGKVKMTATYKGKKYTFTVRVKKPSLEFKNETIDEGEEFIQTLRTAAGKKIANKKIKWKSSNTGVATVSSDGLVKGVKAGKTTITATFKGKNYKTTVTVKKAGEKQDSEKEEEDVIPYLDFVQTGMLLVAGESKKITTEVSPSSADIKWSSSNKKIADVSSDGTVKGLSYGETTITAKMTYKSKEYSATCKVLVEPKSVTLAEGLKAPYYETGKTSINVQSFGDFSGNIVPTENLSNYWENYTFYYSDEKFEALEAYIDHLVSTGNFEVAAEYTSEYLSYKQCYAVGLNYIGNINVPGEHKLQYSDDYTTKYDIMIYTADFANSTSHNLSISCSAPLMFADLGYRMDGSRVSDVPRGTSTAAALVRDGATYKTSDGRFSSSLDNITVLRNNTKISAETETEVTDKNISYKVSYKSGTETKTYRFAFANENNTGLVRLRRGLVDSVNYAGSYEDKSKPFIYYKGGWKEIYVSGNEIDDVTIRVFYQDDYRLIAYVYIDNGTYDSDAITEFFVATDLQKIKDDKLAEEREAERKRLEEEKKREEEKNNSSSSSGSDFDFSSNSSIPGLPSQDTTCFRCGGSGRRSCGVCGGDGWITDYVSTPNYSGSSFGGSSTVTKRCTGFGCLGGTVTCSTCGGDGRR